MFEKDDKQLCTQINRLFNEALKRYALVEDGDRILVGLSGGKDSMAGAEVAYLQASLQCGGSIREDEEHSVSMR